PNEINYFVSTPWDPQEAVKSRLAPYRGAMRSEPSRRMHSPLSMGFSQMWTASAAYSPGSPRREGKGTEAASDFCASSERLANLGVRKRPGMMVARRMPSRERSRATGRVMAATPPLEAE